MAKALATQSEHIVSSSSFDKFNGTVKLFCSHQQTEDAVKVRECWLEGLKIDSVKSSVPPFNVSRNVPWPKAWTPVHYNIATFGKALVSKPGKLELTVDSKHPARSC